MKRSEEDDCLSGMCSWTVEIQLDSQSTASPACATHALAPFTPLHLAHSPGGTAAALPAVRSPVQLLADGTIRVKVFQSQSLDISVDASLAGTLPMPGRAHCEGTAAADVPTGHCCCRMSYI